MKNAFSQFSGKVKILFVITQGEMGGAQRYIFDLATNLDPSRYNTAVATGTEKSDLRDALRAKGISTFELPHLKRSISPVSDILGIFELKNLIKKLNPEIVHLNSSKAGVIGSIALEDRRDVLPDRNVESNC